MPIKRETSNGTGKKRQYKKRQTKQQEIKTNFLVLCQEKREEFQREQRAKRYIAKCRRREWQRVIRKRQAIILCGMSVCIILLCVSFYKHEEAKQLQTNTLPVEQMQTQGK